MQLLAESLPDGVWTELIGLVNGDRVAFAGVSDDKGHVLFYTNSRVLRTDASTISCQQTFSARGVAGIKLRQDDVLLGGAVVADPKGQIVLILSEKGYIKRVPIDEFAVKGRGGLGVLSLNVTGTTGPVVAAAVGKPGRSTTIDVLASDGKRQRLSLRGIPTENRTNQGKKLVKLAKANEIVIWE
jgi:DNA gyrase subunit A